MREERTAEEWAEFAAQKAEQAAKDAQQAKQYSQVGSNHALNAHREIGTLAATVARLEGRVDGGLKDLRQGHADIVSAMTMGFEKLAGRVREQQQSLSDLAELAEAPEDDTLVRNVKTVAREATSELAEKVKKLEADAAAAEAAKAAEATKRANEVAELKKDRKKWVHLFVGATLAGLVAVVAPLVLHYVFRVG